MAELQEPYADLAHQQETATLGVWAFLATEVLFFSSLLTAYCVFHFLYPAGFAAAGRLTQIVIGTANTAVLLTSSLTMALAIHAIELGESRPMRRYLLATALMGLVFIGLKSIEYYKEFADGFVPGAWFHYDGPHPHAVELFFFIYFVATGIHALHLTIGIGAVFFVIWRSRKGAFTRDYHAGVEGLALYWHFVDAVWVFIYPLIYLIGRSSA